MTSLDSSQIHPTFTRKSYQHFYPEITKCCLADYHKFFQKYTNFSIDKINQKYPIFIRLRTLQTLEKPFTSTSQTNCLLILKYQCLLVPLNLFSLFTGSHCTQFPSLLQFSLYLVPMFTGSLCTQFPCLLVPFVLSSHVYWFFLYQFQCLLVLLVLSSHVYWLPLYQFPCLLVLIVLSSHVYWLPLYQFPCLLVLLELSFHVYWFPLYLVPMFTGLLCTQFPCLLVLIVSSSHVYWFSLYLVPMFTGSEKIKFL